MQEWATGSQLLGVRDWNPMRTSMQLPIQVHHSVSSPSHSHDVARSFGCTLQYELRG